MDWAELFNYMLLSVTSLFVVIDPIATAPAFLAMTPTDSAKDRVRMARLATIVAAGVLISFLFVGQGLFKLLGITISAFKIAGSIVLLLIALDMLRAKRSTVVQTVEEEVAATEKEDIAITPLGIPMLAGPGAISTVILLQAQGNSLIHTIALAFCIALVCYATYWILSFAATHGARFISPIAMKITIRIMGLLLAALAIQFVLDAIAEQKEKLFYPPAAITTNAPPVAPPR